jgi:hypothetical protein
LICLNPTASIPGLPHCRANKTEHNFFFQRHWFFRGRIVIDDEEMPHSLMTVVKQVCDMASCRGLLISSFCFSDLDWTK